MNNPAGKEAQFTLTVNGSPVTITSASLKPGDPYTIILTSSLPLSASDIVLVAYTHREMSRQQPEACLNHLVISP